MPGVPSGRGCEGCRKQKKKCDQAFPACSRCTRLRMVCVGAGRQRYKFMEQQPFQTSPNNIQMVIRRKNSPTTTIISNICREPTNELTSLLKSFITTVGPSTDLRFNLAWTYGGYLTDVPSRLGMNEALDSAAAALVEAHSGYCIGEKTSIEALEKYTIALRKLRFCLDDALKARTPETLCAVQLLLLCQSLLGVSQGKWTGHVEGIAQVLRVRGCYNPDNQFEARMLAAMRGSLIFEGLMNSRVQLPAKVWRSLSDNPLDRGSYESKLMGSVCMVPYLIQNKQNDDKPFDYDETAILSNIQAGYEMLKPVLSELRDYVSVIAREPVSDVIIQTEAYHLRLYALTLSIAVVLNCVLSAVNTEDTELVLQAQGFAREMLVITELAKKYRPLGASYVPMCLSFAWIATTDDALKLVIEQLLNDYQQHPLWGSMLKIPVSDLEWASQRLRLQNPSLPSDDD